MEDQKHSESFHASTSDTGTVTSQLAEGRSGQRETRTAAEFIDRRICVSRAHRLGKHHQAVENPESKCLSAEGGMEKKPKQTTPETRALYSTWFFHMHLCFFNPYTQGSYWKIKYFTWHLVFKKRDLYMNTNFN